MDSQHRLHCRLSVCLPAAAIAVAFMLAPSAHGQLCAVGSGASITAGPPLAAGQPLQAAFTVAAPVGGCSVLVESVRVWLPDNSLDAPDACEAANGLELAVSGILLYPGEFLRLTCFDSPMPNCGESLAVNCELLLPEMCYLADAEDAIAGSLLFSACWEGTALPAGEPVQGGLDAATLLVEPQLNIDISTDVDQVCAASPTVVTFTYQVSTGEGDVAVENVTVIDQTGSNVLRGSDTPGNNNNLLEPGEVWSFTCLHEVQGAFTNEVAASGQDIATAGPLLSTATLTLSAACPADLTCDGYIGSADLAMLLSAWGIVSKHIADFNQSGFVGPDDLAVLLSSWGACSE